jgi:hypothetical protein
MKASILSVYPDHRFPHVLFYSTLLAVLSIAAVGLVSAHAVINAGLVSRPVVMAGPASARAGHLRLSL